MKIIDITQELFSSRLYPGDRPPEFKQVLQIPRDMCNLTKISMSVHNGTHIDAPKHFIANGKAVHELDLSVFYGKCTVVECEGIISEARISAILENCHERLLIKGETELSENAATLLANSHVKLVGVESQSVGTIGAPLAIHVILLKKEIIPLEGLNLAGVTPGEYILSAFPLNMQDSDGSPVRAVLIDS
jgi:arylformamidase